MILYHNTSNENARRIVKEGIICGLRANVYGKGSEAEGAGIWCSSVRGYGYGGATITFKIDENDEALRKQNDTEYIVYKNIEPSNIIDIDLVVSSISSVSGHIGTLESDIPEAINRFGKDKVVQTFIKNKDKFIEPYDCDRFMGLVETGNKYLKGTISLKESRVITENVDDYNSIIEEIERIVDTCKKYDITKYLKNYTVPIMRDYQLHYNPTADSRKTPWIYLMNELNSTNEIDSTLQDFIDGFIREGNQCIKDNIKTESRKIQESSQEDINEFIEKELNDGTSWDTDTKLGWLRDTMYKQIRLVGRKINNAKYDYERNNYKRNQDFYKEVLSEIDNRLKSKKTESKESIFYQIKEYNPNAKMSNYKNMNEYQMLKVLQSYKDKASNNKPVKTKQDIQDTDELEEIEPTYVDLNKDYDYDDSIQDKLGNGKGLEHFNEKKSKLEEASRNELLAKAKAETITRYNKSSGYKGFSLVDIDTTAIKTRDSIVITNRVGNYFDSVELDDILYWVGLEVAEAKDNKMTQKVVEKALLGAMDGMDIKVDCNCGDFVYRFAYMATQFEYKYGKPEVRPSDITNPDGYGAMCKHLIALLSNKSWVSQVASTLQQWIIDEIEWVRDFLKMSEEEFKLPDEYARYLGKHGAMKKFWDKQPDEEQDTGSDEANEDSDSDNENEETTNDNPDTENNEEDTKL